MRAQVRYKLLKKLIHLIRLAPNPSRRRGKRVSGGIPVDLAKEALVAPMSSEWADMSLSESEVHRLEENGSTRGNRPMVSRADLAAYFMQLLNTEHARVKLFMSAMWAKRVPVLPRGVKTIAVERDGADSAHIRSQLEHHQHYLEETRKLLEYQEVNYVAFFKIAKKFDKATHDEWHILPRTMARVHVDFPAPCLKTSDSSRAFARREECLRQVEQAVKFSKKALAVQAGSHMLSYDEKRENFGKVDEVQAQAGMKLSVLEATEADQTDPFKVGEQLTQIKADAFSDLMKQVIDGVSISDPETAKALGLLQNAHLTLFEQADDSRSRSPAASPRRSPQKLKKKRLRRMSIAFGLARDEDATGLASTQSKGSAPESPLHGVDLMNDGDGSYVTAGPAESDSTSDWGLQPVLAQVLPAICFWLPRYQFRDQLKADTVAGITLAVLGIPQGLAYASLVGISPIYGIYAVIFPPILYGLLGWSRQGAVGPMSIPCLIIAAVVDKHARGDSMEERVEVTMSLTLIIGCFCFVAGVCRLGLLVDFISNNVLTGFVQASALMVIVTQIPKLLGVSIEKSSDIVGSLSQTIEIMPDFYPGSLAVSSAGIAFLLGLKRIHAYAKRVVSRTTRTTDHILGQPAQSFSERWSRRFDKIFTYISPTMFFIVSALIAGGSACGFSKVNDGVLFDTSMSTSESSHNSSPESITTCEGIKMVGDLPYSWPVVAFSSLRLSAELLQDAMQVSLVILAEHVSNVKLYSSMHNYKVDHNAELMAIGLTNVAGSAFSSFAVGARFTGSAVNNAVGATSQLSLLISGLVALVCMPFAAPLLYFLPKPALSVVVIFAVAGVLEPAAWPRLWKISKVDFMIMLSSFTATLALGVLSGLAAAIAVSLCLFIYNCSQPQILELGRTIGSVDYQPLASNEDQAIIAAEDAGGTSLRLPARRVAGAKILRFESPLAFFNVASLCVRLANEVCDLQALDLHDKWQHWYALILDFSCIPWVDSSAAIVFLQTVQTLQEQHGYPVAIANVNDKCMHVLLATGLETIIPAKHVFQSVHNATRAVGKGTVALGEEDLDFLRAVPLFKKHLSVSQLAQLSSLAVRTESTRVYSAGQIIVQQGDSGSEFFVLKSGRARATITGVGVVREYSAGDYFGEKALVDSVGQRAATVTAITRMTCLVISREDFNAMQDHLLDESVLRSRQVEYGALSVLTECSSSGDDEAEPVNVNEPGDKPSALDTFAAMDTDGNGRITRSNFLAALQVEQEQLHNAGSATECGHKALGDLLGLGPSHGTIDIIMEGRRLFDDLGPVSSSVLMATC